MKTAGLVVALSLILPCAVTAEPPNANVVKVGMLIPLSGPYAAGGVDNRQGIEVALAASNAAVPLEVIYSDSKADPTIGVNEFRKLTGTDNALAVFVMRGAVGMALNPISQNMAVPLLGAVGNKNFASTNKYAFQIWSKSDDEGAFLAERLRARKYLRLAMLTVQDDWQGAVAEEVRKVYPRNGATIVFDQEVVPTDSDFRTQLSRIKAISPDVIFANLALSQMVPFVRQAKDLNVTTKIYSNFWVAKKEVIDSVGPALEGIRFIEMKTNLPTLQSEVRKRYSANPSGATLAGYAATLFLAQAINSKPSMHTHEELYAKLLEQQEIQTPDGPIPIENRCVKFPLVEKVLHNGQVELEADI